MHVDIVGGGLAGLSTAISLKKQDSSISTTIYERHNQIGFNHDGRKCGEAFFSEINNPWIPTGESLFNKIYQTKTIIGKKTYTQQFPKDRTPAFMLNKPAFINQLGKQALENDVTIKTNTRISNINELTGDVIVDASGCPSILKNSLRIDKGLKGLTYQETVRNCNVFNAHTIKIYYFGKVGYYWIFPRDPTKKEVNVGVGLLGTSYHNLPGLLHSFKQQKKITGSVSYYAGGVIPLGLQRPLQTKNILFVGDAGVGTFPYLGEGIRRSLINGEIAADCIVKNKIGQYSQKMMQRFFLWDFIGKLGIKTSNVVSRISENAMFFILHRYFDVVNSQFELKY